MDMYISGLYVSTGYDYSFGVAFYFASFMTLSVYVMLNLLIAFIIDTFSQIDESQREAEKDKKEEAKNKSF